MFVNGERRKVRKSRLGRVAIMTAVLTLLAPMAASAATHSGNISVKTSIGAAHQNTPAFVTKTTAQTCWSVATSGIEDVEWTIDLIWYDGGKNVHLWNSPKFVGGNNVCSPVKTIKNGGSAPKVYDVITDDTGLGTGLTGSWAIGTN